MYKEKWEPIVGERLDLVQEPENEFDQFAVAATKREEAVWHVPIELSRVLVFALEHGCVLDALVLDSKYYPSPLVQGGLEIKVKVSCYWNESGILELKGMIEGRYSFANRMRDDSQSILSDITALMASPESDNLDEIEAAVDAIETFDDSE